jgi:hypothetical protein
MLVVGAGNPDPEDDFACQDRPCEMSGVAAFASPLTVRSQQPAKVYLDQARAALFSYGRLTFGAVAWSLSQIA